MTKYQRINLTKEVKEPCIDNYKTLMKAIEEDTKKWKVFCAHKLDELVLLKYP